MIIIEGRHYAAELGMELRQGSNDPAILKYLSDILDLVEEVRFNNNLGH